MKVSEIFDSFCAAQFQPAERDIFKLFQLFLFLTGIAFAYFTLKYSQTRFVGYCLLFLLFFFSCQVSLTGFSNNVAIRG